MTDAADGPLLEALERIEAIAVLMDDIKRRDPTLYTQVSAVAKQLIHGAPAPRDAVTTVMSIAMKAAIHVYTHGHDQAGARWNDEQLEGGRALLLRLAGAAS